MSSDADAFLRQINELADERDRLQESRAAAIAKAKEQQNLLRLIYAEVGGLPHRQPYDTYSYLPAFIVTQIRRMVEVTP